MRNLRFTKIHCFTVLKTKGRKGDYCQREFRTPGWWWLFTQQGISGINTRGESVGSQLTVLTPCKWRMNRADEMPRASMDVFVILDKHKCFFKGL